jgi:cytochrome c biogenesis protein CcmG/thiol:disulfide interchange protein DsbE
MPSLERLHREFAAAGLEIVAVSVDDAVGKRRIRDFADDLGLTFDILHDSSRAIDRIYQLTGYPVTVIVDREGLIRRRHLGALEWDSYPSRALIASLLGVRIAPDTGRTVGPRASVEGT